MAKALRISGGVVLVTAGIVLVPTPGPGLLVLLAGAALLAGESRNVARALDSLELRLRRMFERIR